MTGTTFNDFLAALVPPDWLPFLAATVEVDDSGIAAALAFEADAVVVTTSGLHRDDLIRIELADRGNYLQGAPVVLAKVLARPLSSSANFVLKYTVDSVQQVYPADLGSAGG